MVWWCLMSKLYKPCASRALSIAGAWALSFLISGCGEGGAGGTSGDLLTGTGGSAARMTIVNNYLYAIAGNRIQLFDIQEPASPAPWTQVTVDWDIETLFPHGDYLLVGAASGVHILDNTDQASPQYVGEFVHATARDPVVAQNNIAYVTLRQDLTRPPPGVDNQMNILDISDVTEPALINTLPMQAPSGLSVRGERLYVCDGVAGLKTFDLGDPANPVVIDVVPGVDCYDVIATDNLLLVISNDGLAQYDLTTGKPLLLSELQSQPVVYIVDR